MRKFLGFHAFLLFVGVVSGCSAVDSRSFTSIDSSHPEVTIYDNATIQELDCSVIWTCVFGNITASEPCAALEFTFDVIDPATKSALVHSAKSYWGSIGSGITEVEWGINNYIPKAVNFSKPIATCLQDKPDPVLAKSMANFPSSFCDGDFRSSCSAQSLSGWELRQKRLAQEAVKNFKDLEPTYGYTVLCNDGWVSESGGLQGACSHHGGVSG
jgi:hypothetical protein